jgi:hypothetical protein
MNRFSPLIGVLVAIVLLFGSVTANQTERVMMVLVQGPEIGWPEQDIQGKLERLITTRNNFELASPLATAVVAEELDGRVSKQILIAHGLRMECRYIVWCDIVREDLTQERGFGIPMVVNQKRLAVRLEIDYRIVDCFRGRILLTDRIKERRFGPSTAQFLDDTGADPGLHLTYVQRRRLFEELEQHAVETIFAELERIAKQR